MGLTLKELQDEDAKIAVATQIRCLNRLAEILNDQLLGFHVVRKVDLRETGFLYYIAASSETLGEALLKLMRYSSIANEGVVVTVQTGSMLRANFDYAGVLRLGDRHQLEAFMTATIRLCRELTGRELRPLSVKIMHQRIPESGEFDAFLGRTAEFGASRDELILPGDTAKLPIISSDLYLNRFLIKYCEEALSRKKRPSGDLRANVENAIAALLPHGEASVENVAHRLGITPRTLRRRLAAESASFSSVLENLRFALAKLYLGERHLQISRIAWLLGYAEVSTFSHAFRRWAGRAPRAVRSGRGASSSRRSQETGLPMALSGR
jgi:AraC-like DNA-binding protein